MHTSLYVRATLARLLFEAYRRNAMNSEPEKPITERWLGLGTATAYQTAINGGYMRWFDGKTPPKRCAGWLVLTEKGVTAMNSFESEFEAVLKKMKELGYERTLASRFQLAGRIVCK